MSIASKNALATVIIPARLASSRFPEKVIAARTGKPLVQHAVEAARRAASVGRVAVATDHARVAEALAPFGTNVVMTAAAHPNGTSRLAEAASKLGLAADAIVVNVQGDEPEIEPAVIDAAVAALVNAGDGTQGIASGPPRDVGTVATPITSEADAANPNIVKVVRGVDGRALYFSRSRIPCDRDGRKSEDARPLRHVGIYAYRRSFLDAYVKLEPTPLERAEMLEQLRVLEHGLSIGVAVIEGATAPGIDTPEQYEAFVERWRER